MLLPILFVIAITFGMDAQTSKGSFMFSLHNFSAIAPEASNLLAPTNALGISFGKLKTEFDGDETVIKFTTIGLSGSGHYFVADNFSAGLNLNVLHQKVKDEDDNDTYQFTILMAGPELRYFIPAGAKTKVWLGGGGSFGSTKSKYSDGDNDSDPVKLTRFGGGGGVAIFPNQHFSLDLGVGYHVLNAKDGSDGLDTSSGLTFDVGFSVFL